MCGQSLWRDQSGAPSPPLQEKARGFFGGEQGSPGSACCCCTAPGITGSHVEGSRCHMASPSTVAKALLESGLITKISWPLTADLAAAMVVVWDSLWLGHLAQH